jgi:hypothetical protein
MIPVLSLSGDHCGLAQVSRADIKSLRTALVSSRVPTYNQVVAPISRHDDSEIFHLEIDVYSWSRFHRLESDAIAADGRNTIRTCEPHRAAKQSGGDMTLLF